MYEIDNRRIIVSRNVVFDEKVFPFQKEQEKGTEHDKSMPLPAVPDDDDQTMVEDDIVSDHMMDAEAPVVPSEDGNSALNNL